MEATVAFGVLNQLISFFCFLTTMFDIFTRIFCEVIIVNEVTSCVVGRINVNHFNFAEIGFLQQFKHGKIVAFDVEILRVIKIYTFFTARAQSIANRRVSCEDGFFLVGPSKLISFFVAFNYNSRKFLTEHIKVDSVLYFSVSIDSFCHAVREQRADSLYVLINLVHAVHF